MKVERIHHYEVVRRLGSGAHGIVYYAYDTKLLRPVVLKMLRSSSSEEARARVLREAQLASAIEHPNVCSIFDVDEHGGRTYLAMQFVPGKTLKDLLQGGALSLPLALSIGAQIADGLAAAHDHGILHRDLKPANIMITEGGLAKILDFGLARRKPEADSKAGPATSRSPLGTTGYMAPEQFVSGRSSEQTDIFALGIVLFQMLTGVHPFTQPGQQDQLSRAIQFAPPRRPTTLRPDLPIELEGLLLRALAKNPADRFDSAGQLRDALATLMRTLDLDVPRRIATSMATPSKAGMWSSLVELVGGRPKPTSTPNSLAVLPFIAYQDGGSARHYGFALADAIASKLSRLPGLSVRASTSLLAMSALPEDVVEAGKLLSVSHVLSGSYSHDDQGFVLTWKLIGVAKNEVETGNTISVESFDLVSIQSEICDEIFAALRGSGQHLQDTALAAAETLDDELSETYLEARATLTAFVMRSRRRQDLDEARRKLEAVVSSAPSFAPGHSTLGIVHLEYARRGFGDLGSLQAAKSSLERALELHPKLVEAKVYRVYCFLALGEKESARHAIHHLWETAATGFDVHIAAAHLLRLDGLYDEALRELAEALRINPAYAHVVYNNRARIYHYRGDMVAAEIEIEKALELAPDHPIIRTASGYLACRRGDLQRATETLEDVIAREPSLQMAYPTLAMCQLRSGHSSRASELITERTRAAADCDGETAYRLATYYAVAGETEDALRWLRRAIYLGNENYSWFATNPAWQELRKSSSSLRSILRSLEERRKRNTELWRRLRGR